MQAPSTLQTWLDDEAAMRATLAAPGLASPEQRRTLSGIEYLQAMTEGTLPPAPIGALMGFIPIRVEAGKAIFQGTPARQHYNPHGGIHGGYAATLLDTALGCAIHTMLPAGKGYTTLELKVNYIRGMNDQTGPVRAEATIVHVGGQVAVAEGRITDANGKLYAFATTTCLVFPI